jgi:pyrroline-5-carboxylate reductase
MRVSFIGGGNMGEAILAALIAKNLAGPEEVAVSDVSADRREHLKEKYGVFVTEDNALAASRGEVVVLSVKPQQLAEAMAPLSGKLAPGQLVLSIVAGSKIQAIKEGLGHAAIARAMPNTPAQIGKGMTVWTVSGETTEAQDELARKILGVMGHAVYTHDEAVLDMATAVSGSGPAYVFLFIESLVQAGRKIGLTPGLARTMAFQTVLGAAEYAYQSDRDLESLIRQVASPGGTTAAALHVLELGFFTTVIKQAVEAAYQRAKELGG